MQAKRAARRSRAKPGARASSEREARVRTGFTLIELIAVVAIFALLMALLAPNLGTLSGLALRSAADSLAGRLELARQRAVMTSVPHRVRIDLDSASHRVEWFVTEAEARGEEEPDEAPELDLRGAAPLPLEAPRGAQRAFRPLPGRLGRDEWLDDALVFRGVDTDAGWIERGITAIEFEPDGTTEAAAVILDDDAGRTLVIDVLPLAEAVRVSDAAS